MVTVSDMTETTTSPCLVCQEHSGEVTIPGGFVVENDAVIAFHCPPLSQVPEPYLGSARVY